MSKRVRVADTFAEELEKAQAELAEILQRPVSMPQTTKILEIATDGINVNVSFKSKKPGRKKKTDDILTL